MMMMMMMVMKAMVAKNCLQKIVQYCCPSSTTQKILVSNTRIYILVR